MKIVFFGSAHFAVPSLKALVKEGYRLCCVVTQPDKKCGRGLPLCSTSVKETALAEKLFIFQPEKVNSADSVRYLSGLKPDLFVVIAYGQLLSKKLLEIPGLGAINVHASYLPKYRGAAPINWSIINGDTSTGITVIKMAEKMDAGDIILQQRHEIERDDTALTLENRLSMLAAQLLSEALVSLKNGNCILTAQDEREASYAPKLKKSDGRINWKKGASEIHCLIKGCLGWPGAFTYYGKNLLKILKSAPTLLSDFPPDPQAGQIVAVSKETITVACGRDGLVIEELQLQGKRPMKTKEFLAGHKIKLGDKLT